MKGKLNGYMTSLEHRYGDPAVYAAQREEMAAEQAVVAYHRAKDREGALSITYNKNRDHIREQHKLRMQHLSRGKPLRYLEVETDPQSDQSHVPPPQGDLHAQGVPVARRSAAAR